MSDKVFNDLERDNTMNKSKIESLQRADGIMNEQLKLLTKNVLEISNIKQTVDSLADGSGGGSSGGSGGGSSTSSAPVNYGTKPTTTIHEHRYFGWAPTTSINGWGGGNAGNCQWHGVQIYNGSTGAALVDGGPVVPINDWDERRVHTGIYTYAMNHKDYDYNAHKKKNGDTMTERRWRTSQSHGQIPKFIISRSNPLNLVA